jgi:isopentenyl diphosphate isomerase/L-lactate dehydrogenase-like FMN-dependent dehydrogenase
MSRFQFDPARASLDALPEIARAVGGQVPLLLDSGVRTGARSSCSPPAALARR